MGGRTSARRESAAVSRAWGEGPLDGRGNVVDAEHEDSSAVAAGSTPPPPPSRTGFDDSSVEIAPLDLL